MRRSILMLLATIPLLTAASAEVATPSLTLDQSLAQAKADAAAADSEARRLEQAAAGARSDAARLQVQQLAAAQAIAAAEARISAADAEIGLIAARQAALQRRLRQEQRPISALLGGLGLMARRPPLLSLANAKGTEDLVQVRVLLDATVPVIRARTQGLRQQLVAGERLQANAAAARRRLEQGRTELRARRNAFAQLEEKALRAVSNTASQALQAGDVALAAAETADVLGSNSESAKTAAGLVAQLSREGPPPAGPAKAVGGTTVPFAYALPASAPVLVGLGAVSSSGVRSRGVLLGTARGSTVTAPASGSVRFAGPFRDFDGVIILDHGGGWMSLIVGVATGLQRGGTVSLGDPIGRALGPVEVELSRGGKRFSPALIAGSSAPLSKSARQD